MIFVLEIESNKMERCGKLSSLIRYEMVVGK